MFKNQIKNHQWTKIFADRFCTLQCSFLGTQQTKIYRDILGVGLHNVIITSNKGYTICYWERDEWENYAKTLAKRVINDNNKAFEWCKIVKEQSIMLKQMMNDLKGKIISLDEYYNFKKSLDTYNPYYTAVKHFANFVPKALADKFLPMLDENRLFTENIYPEIEQFFVQLTNEIEKRSTIPSHLLRELQKEELETYLGTKYLPKKDVLESRYNANVQLFEDGIDQILTGDQVEDIEKQILGKKDIEEIKGQTGYPGIAKGKVKIIFDPRNANHFEKGDILITNMTRPDFVPLMKKAAAIVTDSGGLLCHAAIVAREMKKTTLIGTEKATKIFKDNDLVLVDAEKGIIKKI